MTLAPFGKVGEVGIKEVIDPRIPKLSPGASILGCQARYFQDMVCVVEITQNQGSRL